MEPFAGENEPIKNGAEDDWLTGHLRGRALQEWELIGLQEWELINDTNK